MEIYDLMMLSHNINIKKYQRSCNDWTITHSYNIILAQTLLQWLLRFGKLILDFRFISIS